MPSQLYTTTRQWSAVNRYTAAAEVDIIISNTGGNTAHFDVTNDDAEPPMPVIQGHPVQPGKSRAMKLKSGERLWMAGATSVTLGVLNP